MSGLLADNLFVQQKVTVRKAARTKPRSDGPPNAPRRNARRRGGDELEREAETLRRLADQLEALAEERRASGRAIGELRARRERDLLARAAARLPVDDAEALLDLPLRLQGAVRRVRLSAELLSHHLGTMSALLRKAAR
jgi:Ribonuclease G/E